MNLYASPTTTTGAGTISNPTSLTDACLRAVSGDIIYLLPGTYRGTYMPVSGVTLEGNGNATISGLDIISGFTQVGNHYITQATPLAPLPGSMGADQVFIDGEEVLECRWPVATVGTRGDISSWAEATAVSVTSTGSNFEATYTAPNLPPGSLVDCYAQVLNGSQWISVGGQVIASSATSVTIRFPNDGKDYNIPTVGSRFYLWGGAALPHGFRIAGGYLHLTANPGSSAVEIKARHWGLDLRGRSRVVIRGITLQSCSIRTDGSSTSLVLDSMNIYNLTHFQAPTTYWGGPYGHIVLRDGGRITNTKVRHCGGAFASLRGNGNLVDNVTVTDVSYTGCCQVGVDVQGSNHTVSRSTLGLAGASSLLDMRHVTGSTFRGCEVYGGGGILTDGGTIMFADSQVTTDQGNKVLECVIHDTRGRTGPQPNLYGNAGIYLEAGASAHIRDCHIWGSTSIDLQVVPLSRTPGHVVVEHCTLDSLNISYSGTAATLPITYRHNIVRAIKGGDALNAATIVGNQVDTQRLPGNTQASNIFSTLDRGYPGPYTPANCGARSGPPYFFGAYDTSLSYVASATRDLITGAVVIRLDGPPPPDGFTVSHGSIAGTVRQFILPNPHLTVTFPVTVTGLVDIVLSAPTCTSRTLSVLVPGNLRVTPSLGVTIQGAGFEVGSYSKVLVSMTSEEESWDIPVPIPVADYIGQGLMSADGAGLIIKEGLAMYVDHTYPSGGPHAWVRVPYIPRGVSTFTLLLGGGIGPAPFNVNISNEEEVFLEANLHLKEDYYNKEVAEGITVSLSGTDLVVAGTTTIASKFSSLGLRLTPTYIYGKRYPTRPFSWDSCISMRPNSAGYWQSGLGNNSFLLINGGTVVMGASNQPSTLGGEFTGRLVSNIQLPTSMVWKENLTTINTRDGQPNAKGIFNIMVGQVGKAIDYRFHYIRSRGVPNSGILPTTIMQAQSSGPRIWLDGIEYTTSVASIRDNAITLRQAPNLPPGFYDVRVVLDNGEDYILPAGYEVPLPPIPVPAPVPMPIAVSNPITTRMVGFGPLASRPPAPNPGQVYISYEGVCYTYLGGEWAPYQVILVGSTREALPIDGVWPQGTFLVKVGSTVAPSNTLPLSGAELSLEIYGPLYGSLANTLGSAPPMTNGLGAEGSTHFLLPNYRGGIISIPTGIGIGFGGWVIQQGGVDYSIEWLVVV